MTTFISARIITPFKNEFKGDVSYIEIPTIGGILGILPGHMPIIAAISDGIIKLTLAGKESISFQVTNGGFLKFNNDTCIVTVKFAQLIQKTA